MSKESLDKSMEELAKMTKEAAEKAQKDDCDSMNDADEICKDGLSASELQELSQSLGNCSKEMQDLLDQLDELEMLDIEGMCEGCRNLSPEELEMLLEAFRKCEGCEGMEGENFDELLRACRGCLNGEPCDCFLGYFPCSRPGRGGVTRGPGAAKLNFSGETDEHGASFENKVITPGGIRKDGKMVVKKTTLVAPSGNEASEKSAGGGLGADGGTGGAHTRTILPTHRGVVREYFNRENK
jgi:hypothetical protein